MFGDYGRWEKRSGRGNWKDVLDRDLHRIPKAVVRDINPYIEARRQAQALWGGPDTAQGGPDTAQGGIQDAQGVLPIPF